MANRLVVIPVFPSTTESAALNFPGKAGSALATGAHSREPIQAAPTPQVAPMMKSLRFVVPPAQVLVIRVWTKWLPFRYQNPVTSGVENNSVNLSSFPSEFKPGIVLHHPSRLELQPLFSTHFYSLPLRYKLPPADYGFGLAVIVANNSLPTMWIRIAVAESHCHHGGV